MEYNLSMILEITDLERAHLRSCVTSEIRDIERILESKIPNANHLNQKDKDELMQHWIKELKKHEILVDKLMPV